MLLFIIALICVTRIIRPPTAQRKPDVDPDNTTNCHLSALDSRKRIPVIFANELDAVGNIGNNGNDITAGQEISQPLPPPDYMSTIRSRELTLQRAEYKLLLMSSDDEGDVEGYSGRGRDRMDPINERSRRNVAAFTPRGTQMSSWSRASEPRPLSRPHSCQPPSYGLPRHQV
jgi:hypothetical protein